MWSTWSTLALTKIYMCRFEDLIFSIASEKLNDCLSLKSQGGEREKIRLCHLLRYVTKQQLNKQFVFSRKKMNARPTRIKFFLGPPKNNWANDRLRPLQICTFFVAENFVGNYLNASSGIFENWAKLFQSLGLFWYSASFLRITNH